jgi:hypothetical protein
MNKIFSIVTLFLVSSYLFGQNDIIKYEEINLEILPKNEKKIFWLAMTENGIGQSLEIPVIVLKGNASKPVFGITAAIHGDEVNGIAIIHKMLDEIDLKKLNGTIIAFPVLNPEGMLLNKRVDRFDEDLNRIFPGKAKGTESEQFVWSITQKILPQINYLLDIHTASFGRVNAMYVRSNLQNDTLAQMSKLLNPDIILDSREASAGIIGSSSKTLRQAAEERGIFCITLEAGNPQIIQKNMTQRGTEGILRILDFLNMYKTVSPKVKNNTKYCQKSYWVYTSKGGVLEVIPNLNQRIKKGEVIAIQKDIFGIEVQKYLCPEDGIVIGKSTNPIAAAGGRILHLGIEK